MMPLAQQRKAITAFAGALATSVAALLVKSTGLTAFGSPEAVELLTVTIGGLLTYGLTWLIPNAPDTRGDGPRNE